MQISVLHLLAGRLERISEANSQFPRPYSGHNECHPSTGLLCRSDELTECQMCSALSGRE